MKRTLGEFGSFWRNPSNAKYILLVVAATYATMLCHWDIRHDAASRHFVFDNILRDKDFRSLARNQAGAITVALVVWSLAGLARSRRRGEPLDATLARTARCFSPGLLGALGVATNFLGYDKDLAKAIEALVTATAAGWLWAEIDLWPLRAGTREPHTPRYYARFLALAATAYALVFAWLSVARYQTFYAALNDLGMYTQQLWGNLHGHWFLCSTYGLRGDTMLAEHFMPLILLLTPFYALWQDPRTILFIQALAVALATLPLYGVALRLGLDRRVGLLLAGSYLLHPLLQVATLYDFHPDAFVPLFALGSFWAFLALDERLQSKGRSESDITSRPFPWRIAIAYFLLLILWLSCKEDSMFGVVMLGFYVIVFRRRFLLGLATAALGLAWGMLAMQWIIPHFRGEPYSHVDRYYYLVQPFGWSPEEGSFLAAFAKVTLLHPVYLLGQIFAAPKVLALLKQFGPVFFLSLLGPKEFLIVLPALLANLLSDGYEQYEFRLHYPFAMLPFVYISALVGLRNLSGWLGARGDRYEGRAQTTSRTLAPPSPQLILAVLAFLTSATLCRWFGETPLSRPFGTSKVWRTPHHRLAGEFLNGKVLPPEASLSAQTGLAAHASHRRAIFEFPDLGDRRPSRKPAEYILLDAQAPTWPLSAREYVHRVGELLEQGSYGVVKTKGGYILLRRGHSTELNAAAREMLERYH